MTDERIGDALWPALARLPRGAGVVFRHYGLPLAERKRLFARVRRIARARGLVLVRAGQDRLGREDGTHNAAGRGLRTRSAHSRNDAIAAQRAGADAVFVSPVFATRSHPGASALGRVRLGLLVRGLKVPVIALGGITPARAATLERMGLYGWAAIDAWLPDQKRNAVPT
jgi:thiamine-phosphate pyrophosphorylase